jgi:hypothetical protein
MRSLLVAATVLCGCGKSTPVTPPATVVAEWDSSKASRVPLRSAKIGARTSKDFKVTIDKQAPLVLSVHTEVAPVTFEEAGANVEQTSPVLIRVKVESNSAWDVSGKCTDGPNYGWGPVDATGKMTSPKGMLQDCTIHYQRQSGILFKSSWQLGRTITISGEGTAKAFPADDVTIE